MSEVSNYANLHSVTASFECRARAFNDDKYWLARATKGSQPESFLARTDKIISKMPSNEKQKLTEKFDKIIPKNTTNWKEEYDGAFRDTLTEIPGWDWLRGRYDNSKVEFVKTPNIEVPNS